MNKTRILSSHLPPHVGETVLVQGWLHKRRVLGGITFVVVRDRDGLIQVVVQSSSELEKLAGLHTGTVLSVSGEVVQDSRAPGGVEIHHAEITVEVPVQEPSPIEIDKAIDHRSENLSTLFEWRVLNMRNLREQGIWRTQAAVGDSIRAFLQRHEFTEFHSPKLLAEATEGGAEVFKVKYFGGTAVLAQSAQFYKQILIGSLERVFEFGATYRAEPSVTSRHMTEFITVDVEMGFIRSFGETLNLISDMVNEVCATVWQRCEKELSALGAKRPLLASRFPEVPLQELHELCYQHTREDFRGEKDPSPFEERWICEYATEQWQSEAVFITEFPASEMKFYHYRSEENPEVADRADLLFRGVEIITGSRRENRYEKLVEQLRGMGGDPEHAGYKHYLNAFRYGLPAHAGFGLGLERFTQKMIGLANVKEATLFPRDMSRLAP